MLKLLLIWRLCKRSSTKKKMERSATEKGKDNNKRSDRVQWLFRYGTHGIDVGFLFPISDTVLIKWLIAKSSGLFSPCLTFYRNDTVDHSLLKNSLLSASDITSTVSGRSSFMGSYSSFCPLNVRVLRDSIFGHLLLLRILLWGMLIYSYYFISHLDTDKS